MKSRSHLFIYLSQLRSVFCIHNCMEPPHRRTRFPIRHLTKNKKYSHTSRGRRTPFSPKHKIVFPIHNSIRIHRGSCSLINSPLISPKLCLSPHFVEPVWNKFNCTPINSTELMTRGQTTAPRPQSRT